MPNDNKTPAPKPESEPDKFKERAERAEIALADLQRVHAELNEQHNVLMQQNKSLISAHTGLKESHAQLVSDNKTMDQLLTEAGAKHATLEQRLVSAADKTGAPPTTGSGLGASAPLALKADDFTGPKVRMVFAKPVKLLVDGHRFIQFQAGVQDVPVGLRDHWYLKAHNVKLLE